MAQFMIIGLLDVESEDGSKTPHLALLATCENRTEFLEHLKAVVNSEGNSVKELLCLQGTVLPLKVSGTTIEAIEIAKTEYPISEKNKSEYTSTPVCIEGE